MVIHLRLPDETADTGVTSADHEFGSQATELKLSVVEAYLKAFTTALRGKFSELWYAVMFLDPYGMSVDWQTLQAIAKTQAIDVWYLFSLSGLYRQAARSAAAIDDDKRAAITRVLGTDAWERELYAPSLFADQAPLRRTADVGALQDYVRARLKTIFPAVLPPLPLPIDKKPQMLSLFFAISNPDGPAIGLATRIANHILRAGMSSQRRPR